MPETTTPRELAEDHLARLNLVGKRNVWKNNHPKIAAIVRHASKYLRSCNSVAEFGVGDAYLMRRMVGMGKQYTGLDISSFAVDYHNKQARVHDFPATFKVQDIADPDGYGLPKQDAVFCLDILEHISEPQYRQSLTNIHTLLVDGGYFLGTVPYNENLQKSMVQCPECGHTFHRIGHQQSFDLDKLRASLGGKFAIVKLGVLRGRSKLDWMLRMKKVFLYPLRRYAPGDTIYFIAQKR